MKTDTRSDRIFPAPRTEISTYKNNFMNFKKIIRILALTPIAALALEPSPVSEIKVLQTYTNWAYADVKVVLQSTSGVCKGYWFNKDDAGYQSNLSMLIAAYQASTTSYMATKRCLHNGLAQRRVFANCIALPIPANLITTNN